MRGAPVFLVLLLLLAGMVTAEVEREMPAEAEAGATVAITLIAQGSTPGQSVVVGELLPEGAALTDWSVDGASGVQFTQEGQSLVWEFTAESAAPGISYSVTLPQEGSTAAFSAVYAISPDSFGNTKGSIAIAAPAAPAGPTPAPPVAVEQPTPVQAPGNTLPLLAGLTFIAVILGMALYIWKRIHDTPAGHHISVTEFLGIAARIGALRTSMELTRPSAPPGYTHVHGDALEHLDARQQRMVAQVESYEEQLRFGDTSKMAELEALKQELLSIRFSYQEA